MEYSPEKKTRFSNLHVIRNIGYETINKSIQYYR